MGSSARLYNTSLILPVFSPWLRSWNDIVRSTGATPDYDMMYQPHITIAEGCDDIPTNIVPIDIPVYVSEIFYMEWERVQ